LLRVFKHRLGTYGGNSDQGSIFKMTPAGVVSALALFDQNTTGRNPAGTLVEDSAGNLYGTTINIFSYTGPYDRGVIFRVTPAGIVTVLVNFKDTESANPSRSLTKGVDGNFYGTTGSGGANKSGIFFKMTPAGVLTKVSDFPTRVPTSNFLSELMQASDGNFYGTTSDGGAFGTGTLYRISPTGVVNTLVSFDNGPDGGTPLSTLVQASDGNLYGITDYGGTAGAGTAFRLDIQASTSGTNLVPATIGGTFADLDGNATVTLTASAGSIIQNNAAGTWSWNSTGVPAPFSGPVTITATDSDGAIAAEPFTLSLISTSAPEIAVHNGSHGLAPELSDGQSTAVGFGSTAPNVAILRSFLVRNSGTSALTISGITVPSGYTTNAAGTVLAPGGSYGFQVSLKSGTSATYSGNVVISSDDSDEAVFDFPISCTVVAAGSAPLVLISNDIAVPGSAGAPVLGGPVGSTLYNFVGSPAINSSGVLASAVQIRHADASLHAGMMSGQPLSLIATDTQAAPSLPGVNHFNFAPPVINETGHVAFLGEVRGTGITANVNSRCLFSNASDGTLRLVARTGTDIGLGSNLKSIGNFSIGGDLIIFLGTLADKSIVLFGWDASTGLRPLMRNGQSVTANGSPKIVKNFSILETGNASSGHGRELSVAPSGEMLVTFNVTFTDGTFGVIVGSFDGTSDTGFDVTYGASQQLADTYAAPAVIPLAKWGSFRSPGFDNTGSYYGFISQMLTNTLAGVSTTNNVGVFVDTAPGLLTLQLRENDAAPGTTAGVVFSDFSDLVLGGGDYEFLVKGELRGAGVTVNVNNVGLWAQHAVNGLELVAREGSEAPGVTGSTFLRLNQIALPGTAQPLFQATMTTGVGGVTTANDTGLWVINESGAVKLAVREGDTLSVNGTPRVVTAITALLNGTTTGGALGRRVFLEDGQMTLLLTFSGGIQANAKVVVP
jgi:uncharacterized repeat protein (TIGR03803 family)